MLTTVALEICVLLSYSYAHVSDVDQNNDQHKKRSKTDTTTLENGLKHLPSVEYFADRLLQVEVLGKTLHSRQKSVSHIISELQQSLDRTSEILNIMQKKMDETETQIEKLKTCQCLKENRGRMEGEEFQDSDVTDEGSGEVEKDMFECFTSVPEDAVVPTDWINVALNKPTKQSTTHSFRGLASHAVDGNKASSYWSVSCSHTLDDGSDNDPWWQVDLGRVFTVVSVKITNRGDCCANRMRNFTIELHQCDPTTNVNTFPQMCYWKRGELGHGTVKVFCYETATGRYLRIKKHNQRVLDGLTLCEVEVQAQLTADNQSPTQNLGHMTTENIALGKPTIQSSTMTGMPFRAVDNNSNTNWSGRSCTHTSVYDFKPYWQVDLQASYEVTRVNITNRSDCCAGRLSNFKVEVYKENPVMNTETRPQLCKRQRGRVSAGATVALTCTSPVIGQFVRISKNTLYLTLCEVTVEGTRA